MLATTLAPLWLSLSVVPSQLDTLDTVKAMLAGDPLAIAATVEVEVEGVPMPVPCPDCSTVAPCPKTAALFADWIERWAGLGKAKDFESGMRRMLVEGFSLSRGRSSHAWPAWEGHVKRLRKEGDLHTVQGLLRLELLDRLEGQAQADAARGWLRSASEGRSITVDGLLDFELRYVERFGGLRPERGPIGDAIRDHRFILRSAIDRILRSGMPRGYDVRAQEALVVRWMARDGAAWHDVLVDGAKAAKEERWSSKPLYFGVCLRLGTRRSLDECIATFRRIEDQRKAIEREASRASKLLPKRAPRDWELSKEDWSTLREAVMADHERVTGRKSDALLDYQREAEELLMEFARGHGGDAPEPGAERPHRAWSKWWKAARGSLDSGEAESKKR